MRGDHLGHQLQGLLQARRDVVLLSELEEAEVEIPLLLELLELAVLGVVGHRTRSRQRRTRSMPNARINA